MMPDIIKEHYTDLKNTVEKFEPDDDGGMRSSIKGDWVHKESFNELIDVIINLTNVVEELNKKRNMDRKSFEKDITKLKNWLKERL